MCKVLLIYPPVRLSDPAIVPPLGLMYVASFIRQYGHEVEILDVNAYRYPDDEVIRRIEGKAYDVIGIGGLCTVYSYAKWLCQAIKQPYPKTPIVMGGSISSSMPEFLLSHTEADIAVIGEGEYTMQELLTCFEKGEDIGSVPGIYYKKDGEVVRTVSRGRINDLDKLPFPARDLVPMDIYIRNQTQSLLDLGWIPQDFQRGRTLRAVSLITDRGCPQRCTFCYRNFGQKIRYRSIPNVMAEMKALMESYDANVFDFLDENFTVSRSRVLEFCDYLAAEKLSIAYRIVGGRVDQVDEEVLLRLKETGCYGILYGIESGSQKMLDVMKKDTTVADNRRALDLMRKVGLRYNAPWIIGMPGENAATIKESKKFYKKFGGGAAGAFYATPYPGTELWEMAKQMGKINDEEQLIVSLGDVTQFAINLTDAFTDEELQDLVQRLPGEVNRAGLATRTLSNIRAVISYYKRYGLLRTVRRILQEATRWLAKSGSRN